MITFFKVLEGALAHLEDIEGIEAHEVHEAEIELCSVITTQCCIVSFPEYYYMCFTYSDWRPGEFIGYRTDKCYYCGEDEEEGHDCIAGVA